MSMPPDPQMSQDAPGDSALDVDQVIELDPVQDQRPELEQAYELEPQPIELLTPEPAPEPEALEAAAALEIPVQIPVAEPAPLSVAPRNDQLLGLPLQLVNQLLARLGTAPLQSLADLGPALRLLALLLLAGFVLKLTGATLGALNEIPMLGRLLELVGLISALNFLARNALRSQKRAELLTRIQALKRQFLG